MESQDETKVVDNSNKKRKKAGGRQKGTPNVMTRELKSMILEALDGAGGVEYLIEQAHAKPAAFLTLVGKVLPLQVTGKDGGPIALVTGFKLAPLE